MQTNPPKIIHTGPLSKIPECINALLQEACIQNLTSGKIEMHQLFQNNVYHIIIIDYYVHDKVAAGKCWTNLKYLLLLCILTWMDNRYRNVFADDILLFKSKSLT